MHDCSKIEEILVIAGQLLPENNEVTDAYEEIQFNHCPVCGTKFSNTDDFEIQEEK
ncbi:hypothetical protein [Clostridium kluyveri]|uniref:hypothetical protein n=1 Tax=Clostridium kluyveri TaxID=1534 RepID=UPI002247EA96|nr:hypothetical protein [Clostridium kluyveri]UZQ49837.1 hypothetical protein OP486_18105 [Clostridium kluyveri]